MKTIAATVLVMICACSASGVIIDHSDIDALDSLPAGIWDNIGQQTWFFTHASVGGNMINGINSLHNSDSSRYQLVSSSDDANPPINTINGRIYEYQRGNPGWLSKFNIFESCVRTTGWDNSKVDIVMDKLCYIDTSANSTVYTTMMSALEADFPNLIFVYTTMPIKTSVNVAARTYNAAVRDFCRDNDRILFDIADMEAHTPEGVLQTASYGGTDYPVLYSAYTSDGGHLNTTGAAQIAKGWYAVAAYIDQNRINNRLPGDANEDGVVDLDDFIILKQYFGAQGPNLWSYGDFNSDQVIDLDDFIILKQNYGRTADE